MSSAPTPIASRQALSLSQIDIASRVGISQKQLANYERGQNEPPLLIVVQLASVLDASVDYLLGLTDVSNPPPVK